MMLELPDIQGIVTAGYGQMPHARFLCLQIQDVLLAKAWLQARLPYVTTSSRRAHNEPKPKTALNLALTSDGLSAWGLPHETLQTFSREFQQGMAHGERTKVLGDTRDCDPTLWQFGGMTNPPIHVLLMLYATSEHELNELTSAHWTAAAGTSGLGLVFQQESYRRSVNEPFGFRDGISQPAIEGTPGNRDPGQDIIKAGEFILGYVNEYGEPPPMPTVSASLDSAGVLDTDKQSGQKAFGLNGTYLVLRKLSQDVEGFWNFVEKQTCKADGTSDISARELLAAKMVGRWRSGAPLTLTPEKDDPELGRDGERNNDFTFMESDAQGFGCPISSHIRRANPRDTLQPNPTRSRVIANRHRLVRRGRPYEEGGKGTQEEGIVFIAINADIQRQFEFVQQTWLNSPKFGGLVDCKDPLTSDNDGTGSLVLQRNPVRKRIEGLPRFVFTKGGGYFFLPGMKALKFLANL